MIARILLCKCAVLSSTPGAQHSKDKRDTRTTLRTGRGFASPGGTRVPKVLARPGPSDAPSTCDTPVISHDRFPTLLAPAGLSAEDVPESTAAI
ncbi:MAG: hypothetical protein Kow0022_12940 [Phycisphaerales bacterium]